MKLKISLALLALPFATPCFAADDTTPLRTVNGTTITSTKDPAIRVQLPSTAVYVGAVRWPLYKVADAEIHAYVEADPSGMVQRFYWVQFEQLLPSSKGKYDLGAAATTGTLSSFPVQIVTDIDPGPNKATPGSDSHAFRAMLANKGYRLPTWVMDVGFFHFPTVDRRQEVMIIYGEGFDDTAAEMVALRGKGKQVFTWAELSDPVIKRANERIRLSSL